MALSACRQGFLIGVCDGQGIKSTIEYHGGVNLWLKCGSLESGLFSQGRFFLAQLWSSTFSSTLSVRLKGEHRPIVYVDYITKENIELTQYMVLTILIAGYVNFYLIITKFHG